MAAGEMLLLLLSPAFAPGLEQGDRWVCMGIDGWVGGPGPKGRGCRSASWPMKRETEVGSLKVTVTAVLHPATRGPGLAQPPETQPGGQDRARIRARSCWLLQ